MLDVEVDLCGMSDLDWWAISANYLGGDFWASRGSLVGIGKENCRSDQKEEEGENETLEASHDG